MTFLERVKNSVLVRGSAILLASNFIVRGLDYLFQVIMGRALQPHEYGLLSMVIPLQFMIIMLSSIGIAPSVARFTARHIGRNEKHMLSELYSSVSFYYTLFGVLLGIIVFAASGWIANSVFHTSELVTIIRITAIGMPLGVFVSVFTGFFQGFKEMHKMSVVTIAQQGFRIILASIFVLLGYKAFGAMLGATLSFVLSVSLAFLIFSRYGIKFSKTRFSTFLEVFKFSIPTTITGFAMLILSFTDIIMIGMYVAPEAVGLYAAASPTARLSVAVAIAVSATILPIIAEKKAQNAKEMVKRHTYNSLKIFFTAAVPLAIVIFFAAPHILGILFGPAYVASTTALRILLVGAFFMSIHIVLSGSFQGIGRPSIPMYVLITVALLNIVLNYMWIPTYGIVGASVATAISSTIGGLASLTIFVLMRNKI